jgi:hypothetical protein
VLSAEVAWFNSMWLVNVMMILKVSHGIAAFGWIAKVIVDLVVYLGG